MILFRESLTQSPALLSFRSPRSFSSRKPPVFNWPLFKLQLLRRNTSASHPQLLPRVFARKRRFHKIKKALLINVAHTSTVGCMATILGSTSGLYLRDYFHFTYGYDAVTALSWTLLGLPVAAVSVLLCALITYYLFLRSYDIQEDRETINVITEIIKKKRKFLGKLTCKERILMAALALLFVCCITISGISSLFGLQEQLSIKYAHESVNVMVVVVLLSFLPHGGRKGSVLDWKNVSGRISWRALLSVGGGLSLAGAIEWTGLSRRITEELSSLDFLTPLQTQVVLILLTTVLTEVNTNVVIARFLIPIASDILYPGLAVKLSSILLVLATVNTVGVSLFSLGDLPAWAVAKNGIMTGALANASSAA